MPHAVAVKCAILAGAEQPAIRQQREVVGEGGGSNTKPNHHLRAGQLVMPCEQLHDLQTRRFPKGAVDLYHHAVLYQHRRRQDGR